jgi:hypothetical protein
MMNHVHYGWKRFQRRHTFNEMPMNVTLIAAVRCNDRVLWSSPFVCKRPVRDSERE